MTQQRFSLHMILAAAFLWIPLRADAKEQTTGLAIQNGWYMHNDKVIWGYAQHNGWWRAGQRANITRNAPGEIRPNRTENLTKLTDAMLNYGYPGFEHNFGLWYDRRRDRHDTGRRTTDTVVPPFLEQPWARSGKGTAWDGLSKYDLTKYNNWYFDRLKAFADLCDRKGTILFHNFYMQHALLEQQTHYVDFPWRPVNCQQQTDMPDRMPAASAFYDVSHPLRRTLHQAYIRKCLDVLGENTNVVFLCSEEYTGPLSFMQFWLDTLCQWQQEKGRKLHIGVSATKDVQDAILADPVRAFAVNTIDLRYWWYRPDGTLFAPQGGRQIPARFTGGFNPQWLANVRAQTHHYTDRGMGRLDTTSTQQVYRQIRAYRDRYPRKAILHQLPASLPQAWAMLMAGGSMCMGQMSYPDKQDPPTYISPEPCQAFQPTYDFIREHLATVLPRMSPNDKAGTSDKPLWCLADADHNFLIYTVKGGSFQLDLSSCTGRFSVTWFNPPSGDNIKESDRQIEADDTVMFRAPDERDWVLWLSRKDKG